MKKNILAEGPAFQVIDSLKIPDVQLSRLDNGIHYYQIPGGAQEVVKIELVFLAGRPYEKVQMASKICANLLKEGTSKYSSKDIALFFDNYGATLSTSSGMDTIQATLYCLTKHIKALLHVFLEIIEDASFDEKEFEKFKTKSVQQLSLDLEKNDIVAYRELTKNIFGESHPYGYNSEAILYEHITLDDIKEHYQDNIIPSRCRAFVSGNFSDEDDDFIKNKLSELKQKENNALPNYNGDETVPSSIKFPSKNPYQTAIRIGRRMFSRAHSDYAHVFFMSTVLGGYFGSRLMSNIREEKGYTYGIHCSLDNMIDDGYFMIGTEVANEFLDATIKEIHKEIRLLQTELVSTEEMTVVKNYLLGNFLRMMDGPFNISQLTKTFTLAGLDLTDLEKIFVTVKNISAEEVRECACKYLNIDDLWTVTVGQ